MVNPNRSLSAARKCHNRIAAVMAHTKRYAFRGTSRLAADAGLAKATVCVLIHGRSHPLYRTFHKVVKCLEWELGRSLPYDELMSSDGRYPTMSVCELLNCKPGCMPDAAFNEDGSRDKRSEWMVPGHWTGDAWEFAARSRKLRKRR